MFAPKELLDATSVPYGKPELDIFTVPPTQVGVEDSFFTEVMPKASVTSSGPWEFKLDGSQFMTDLSKNYIFIRLQIVQGNGNNLPELDDGRNHPFVGPINLLGKTLFEQLKLYLNGKMIYDTGDTYSYISYLTTMLQYGKEVKDTWLQAAGYWKDDPDHIDTLAQNDGWTKRGNKYLQSRYVELMAPLDFPLAQQERYLPSNVDVKVTLHRHKDNFILLSPEANPAYKIRVEDIRWFVRQVQITPALEMTLHSAMQKQMAKYPVRRLQVSTLFVPQNTYKAPSNTLWHGQIPRRIVIGLVAENAYNGSYQFSPFNFQHFDVRKVWVVANGETYPKRGRAVQARFDQHNQYMQLFMQFYEAIGLAGRDKSVDLDLEDLKKGHCLIAIDLKADTGVEDNSWEVIRRGTTNVHVELGTAVHANTGGVWVICMGEFDNLVTIDANMQVYSDFAV